MALNSNLGSRRTCEELIRSGAVRVNGVVARIGQSVDPASDAVTVDGRRVAQKLEFTYLMYNKPSGVLCTFGDSEETIGRVTLTDVLRQRRIQPRLFSIGRLDIDAEGLLLLTDDGDLTMRLSHPRQETQRIYEVGLRRALTAEDAGRIHELRKISPLFHLKDRNKINFQKRPERIHPPRVLAGIGGRHVRIRVKEGRNREVKRIFAEVGHQVTFLRRIAFGPLNLGKLAPGGLRPLTSKELDLLKKS